MRITGQMILIFAMALLVALYVLSYIGSRAFLRENFQDGTFKPPVSNSINRWTDVSGRGTADDDLRLDRTIPMENVERPYLQDSISDLGDYEVDIIYKNEADKPLQKEMRDRLMSQYPLDWSGYPPSSTQFQAGLKESFQNATPTVPDNSRPYQNISGSNMAPPDSGSVEAEERRILMTYQPKFPPDATSYDPEDVKDLVTKVYAVKGLKPEIKRRGDTNVYDIINTHKIGDEVKMEPEPIAVGEQAPASKGAVDELGEGTASGEAPSAVAKDPFFENTNTGESNKWDYTAWTPGLERAFAPTNPTKNWW